MLACFASSAGMVLVFVSTPLLGWCSERSPCSCSFRDMAQQYQPLCEAPNAPTTAAPVVAATATPATGGSDDAQTLMLVVLCTLALLCGFTVLIAMIWRKQK